MQKQRRLANHRKLILRTLREHFRQTTVLATVLDPLRFSTVSIETMSISNRSPSNDNRSNNSWQTPMRNGAYKFPVNKNNSMPYQLCLISFCSMYNLFLDGTVV